MLLIIGMVFLVLLSITLWMLWGHEKIAVKRVIPHAVIKEYWDGDERRLHTRFKEDLEVEYSVERKSRLKKVGTINLSRAGMKLLLDEKLPKGAIISLKLFLPEKRQPIEIESEIVWTNDTDEKDFCGKRYFHSGLKFIAIREPSGTHFSQYITHLESEG